MTSLIKTWDKRTTRTITVNLSRQFPISEFKMKSPIDVNSNSLKQVERLGFGLEIKNKPKVERHNLFYKACNFSSLVLPGWLQLSKQPLVASRPSEKYDFQDGNALHLQD